MTLNIRTGQEIYHQLLYESLIASDVIKNCNEKWVSVESLKDTIIQMGTEGKTLIDLYQVLSPTIKIHMGEQK